MSFDGSNMETAGLMFIFHQTASLLAKIEEYLGEQILEISFVYGAGFILAGEVPPADVESRAELMGAGVGGIDVHTPELPDMHRGAEQTRDLNAIAIGTSRGKRVDEISPYVGKESGGFGHEIRHRMGEGVHKVVGAARYLDKRAFREVGIVEGVYGVDAEAFGMGILIFVAVVEDFAKRPQIFHTYTVMIPRSGRNSRF